jgi:hypothetical protein
MPGIVCTVVPASGSRSSLLTPRLKSEFATLEFDGVSGN